MSDKNKLTSYIDTISDELLDMADYIFDNPELGLEEFKATKVLNDYLEKNGFEVEKGLADLPTAFKATYQTSKNPKISIGLLCEYDALQDLGHACSHHMQGPSIVGVAKALKDILKDEDFKIVVYGTPAEETLSSKTLYR